MECSNEICIGNINLSSSWKALLFLQELNIIPENILAQSPLLTYSLVAHIIEVQ